MKSVQLAAPLRLREKFLAQGAQTMSDIELLALFISSGSSQRSCTQLAHDLLRHFGDLRAILNADLKQFCQLNGLGPVRFVQLQALKEICRRGDLISLQKEITLTHAQQTFSFLKRQLRDKRNETFAAIFLDNQHRVLGYEELFQGSINSATIHTRPIIERVMHYNAAALILAHNHPSGDCTASQEDLQVTRQLLQALHLIEVRLLDHVVVGDNQVYSILGETTAICH